MILLALVAALGVGRVLCAVFFLLRSGILSTGDGSELTGCCAANGAAWAGGRDRRTEPIGAQGGVRIAGIAAELRGLTTAIRVVADGVAMADAAQRIRRVPSVPIPVPMVAAL